MPGIRGPFGTIAFGSQGLLAIDPLSLGPFIYLESIRSFPVAIDGSNVAVWPDLSGNGHDGDQGVVNQQPVYHKSGIHTSANGAPGVEFKGLDDPAGASNVGGALAPNNPSVANGYDILVYGRFLPAINSNFCSVIFQDDTGGRPQCGYQDANFPNQKWFERDDLGTKTGALYANQTIYGVQRWLFAPSGPNNGTLTTTANDTQEILVPYQFNPLLAHGWGIGTNQSQNCPCRMDVFAFAWFTKNLTTRQYKGVVKYWKGKYG